MNRLPPKIVRRLVLAPAIIALCLCLLALAPIVALLSLIYGLMFDRRLRVARVAAFVSIYSLFEIVSILTMLGLWIGSGFGLRMKSPKMQALHYRYMRWWLKRISRSATRFFLLRIEIEDPPAPQAGPVLVFSRHAGPGNSLMLVGTIMIGYRRTPRIVMLAKLQWDPWFDIIGNRLPNRFIRHDAGQRTRSLEVISELAGGTKGQDAFVLFPEGRDFTPRLRLRAIASLRKGGFTRHADKAELLRRMLPPRHNGVMAAVNAAPEADVIFVAHTVLEDVGAFGELWHRIPFTRPVAAKYWRVPAAEVPREQEQLIDWLYEWWGRIDEWIDTKIGKPTMPAGWVEVAEAAETEAEAAEPELEEKASEGSA